MEKLPHPFSLGFFSSMVPIYPVNFKLIGAGVLLLLSENKMQDGCHGGHIGKVTTPIFTRVLLLHGPNLPCEFQMDRCKRSPAIEREPNSRWLPWRPHWKVTAHIFTRVFLHGPNPPYEFQMDRCKCSPVIERKPNSRWLPWWPFWNNCDTQLQ